MKSSFLIFLIAPAFFVSACKRDASTINPECPVLRADLRPAYPLPDAFTPDGNGINDRLVPLIDSTITSFDLSVYDRSGDEVATRSGGVGWDGIDSRTGRVAAPAPYQVKYRIERKGKEAEAGTLWVTIFGPSQTQRCVYAPTDCDPNVYTFSDQYIPDTTFRFYTGESICPK